MKELVFDYEECTGCGTCVEICPAEALVMEDDRPELAHPELCKKCGVCVDQCPMGAIKIE